MDKSVSRAKSLQYLLLYFIFFLGHGIYFSTLGPYVIDAFGKDAGVIFTAGQIGYPLGFFLSGILSDRTRRLRSLLIGSLVLHAPIQFLLYSTPENLWITILAAGGARFLFAVNFQLISIAVLEALGTPRFGQIRAWGTGGFFLIHLLLFLADASRTEWMKGFTDARMAGELGSLLHLLTVFPAVYVRKYRISSEVYRFKDALASIQKSNLYVFFVFSFLFFFSYQVVDFFLGHFLKQNGGMGSVYLGWALAVLLEIPFLHRSGKIHRGENIRIFFLISLGAGVLRFFWLGYASFGSGLRWVLFSQVLHGLHFTGYYMGAIYTLRKKIPDHLYGTAYGIYVTLTVALGGAVGSMIYAHLLHHSETLVSYIGPNANFSSKSPYFLLFLISGLVHLILFFTFIFYSGLHNGSGSTSERVATQDTSENLRAISESDS